MKFKAVVFDLFGTLVPYIGEEEFNLSLHPLAEILDTELDVIKDFWASPQGFRKAIMEYTSTKERVTAFSNIIGTYNTKKINAAVHSRIVTHAQWLVPKPTTLVTLEKINSMGLKIGLISECSAEVPELWETTPISKYIDVALFSCLEHMNKSTIDIFQLCCDRLEISGESMIYAGDSIGELRMARQLGMFPILMKTRKKVDWRGASIEEPIDVLCFELHGLNKAFEERQKRQGR